jgi:BMFP domain-containing protein YqiC
MAQDTPLDGVLDRIRESLANLLPPERFAEMNDRVSRAVTAGLERFQLVPKEDFEREKALVARLARDVERLEARIAALEATDSAGSDLTSD